MEKYEEVGRIKNNMIDEIIELCKKLELPSHTFCCLFWIPRTFFEKIFLDRNVSLITIDYLIKLTNDLNTTLESPEKKDITFFNNVIWKRT